MITEIFIGFLVGSSAGIILAWIGQAIWEWNEKRPETQKLLKQMRQKYKRK